jgi:uncharacterized coiled-coil protein SlyX
MLPTIAVVIGAIAILVRLPVLIAPEKAREIGSKLVTIRPLIVVMGLIMLGAGGLIAYAGNREAYSLEFVLWIIGKLFIVFGVMYVIVPSTLRSLWDRMVLPRSATALRVMGGIGTVIGLFILILGLTWMGQGQQGNAMRATSPELATLDKPSRELVHSLHDRVAELDAAVEENSRSVEEMREKLDTLAQDVQKLQDTVVKRNSEQIAEVRQSLNKMGDALDELRESMKPDTTQPPEAPEKPKVTAP